MDFNFKFMYFWAEHEALRVPRSGGRLAVTQSPAGETVKKKRTGSIQHPFGRAASPQPVDERLPVLPSAAEDIACGVEARGKEAEIEMR